MFVRPKKLIRTSGAEALGYVDIRTLAEGMCRYDLNEEDVAWLQIANEEFAEMGELDGAPRSFFKKAACCLNWTAEAMD